MKALRSKMGGGKKKETPEKADEDGKASASGKAPASSGIGSSAWRRRLEESAMQKLGLSSAEKDENTGDLDDAITSFRAAAL